MTLTVPTQMLPLQTDAAGTWRVGATRVSLDVVLAAFNAGIHPEEIVQRFPTLDLGDVYAIIGYYLHNQAFVDRYLAEQQAAADAIRRDIEARQHPDPLRAKLLAARAQHDTP
ncbi:MAG: DUF433 domain-containing protein [Chloroflexota bacterium]|nr:DUF433 domain-containing protein [Chloroflexota bacterium]